MQQRIRTALLCCFALIDLGLMALVPVSTHWLNPAPAGLQALLSEAEPDGTGTGPPRQGRRAQPWGATGFARGA